MLMGYANKSFVELIDWIYVRYGQITPVDLTRNQGKMKSMYNVEDPIEILFYQMDTGQEFTIAGNSSFSDWQLADMGVAKIVATQEYTHEYRIWKIIAADEHTWVRFKAHSQESYLYREEPEQTTGAAGYGGANNVMQTSLSWN